MSIPLEIKIYLFIIFYVTEIRRNIHEILSQNESVMKGAAHVSYSNIRSFNLFDLRSLTIQTHDILDRNIRITS